MARKKLSNNDIAVLFLRIGLAAVFIYAAVSSFRQPVAWQIYLPSFTTHIVSAKISLDIISIVQIVIAAALIVGKYVKYAAAVAAVLLAGIILFNIHTLLITFRDIGLVFMALALFVLAKD